MNQEIQKLMMRLPLDEKLDQSKQTIEKALHQFSRNQLYVAWSGGKDSTTMLWLYREVCRKLKKKIPKAIFIDDTCMFDEAIELVKRVKEEWDVEVKILENRDVSDKVNKRGDMVKIADLNEKNRKEVEKLGVTESHFPFEPDSYACSHLMKTVTMNVFIENNNVKALSSGIRWGEHEARMNESFFSIRKNPFHVRIHPIIHLSEREVWDIINTNNIPFCSLYARGYRSIGNKNSTVNILDEPAWKQDLENTSERAGRNQEKEDIIRRLRALGYM